MTDSNIANAVEYVDETYEPSDIKKARDRTDLLHLVRMYVHDLLDQELYGRYMLPDDRCEFWPREKLATKYVCVVWPVFDM